VCHGIYEGGENNNPMKSMGYGAQGRNRTTDTGIFNPRVGLPGFCERFALSAVRALLV